MPNLAQLLANQLEPYSTATTKHERDAIIESIRDGMAKFDIETVVKPEPIKWSPL